VSDPRIPPAAARFGDAADLYHRARPGYPEDLLDVVATSAGLGPGTDVVDLAAGTGKLTGQLVARGATVTAVEPSAGMRERLRAAVPECRVLDGTAEAIPLGDATTDIVTVAQAFHWFRTAEALDELARVLRPGGWMALVWNEPPVAGWARELWDLRHRLTGFDGAYPGRGLDAVVDADRRFGHREVVTATHRVTTTRSALTGDTASRSYVHVLDAEARRQVIEEVDRFVAEHPDTAGRTELVYERPSVAHLCRLVA
jgi:SAM-dependent methyltransferase